MGVAGYQLSPQLPSQLQGDLPTRAEFAREFPLMSLVRLRIEIEREVRDRLAAAGLETERTLGLLQSLRDLQAHGAAPAGTDEFLAISRALNDAAHGVDVAAEDVRRAEEIGAAFLAELRADKAP